jgi:hypothetical protein
MQQAGFEPVGTWHKVITAAHVPLIDAPVRSFGTEVYYGRWAPTWAVIIGQLQGFTHARRRAAIGFVAAHPEFQQAVVAAYRLAGEQGVISVLQMEDKHG